MWRSIGVRKLRGMPPTPLTERALAPDLARGAMLVLIALANVRLYLYGREAGVFAYPLAGDALERIVLFLQVVLVDGRAYPMFAALFGYGIVQLSRRLPDARKVVRRRGAWMIAIGALHGVLLFSADIVGAYGLIAVAGAGVLLKAKDRTLATLIAGWLVLAAAAGVMESGGGGGAGVLPSMLETDRWAAVVLRVQEWVVGGLILQALLGLVAPVLIGVWAARRRVLDEPERHRRLLRWVAAVGLPLAIVGGLPKALMVAGWWADPSSAATIVADSLHNLTGYAGGVGYAALAGLLAIRYADHRNRAVTALAALGQRSLSGYLAQSVVFVAVLASYGGGLGDDVGVPLAALLAVATWAATVLAADLMRRRGYRGPAEVVLRRLTYKKVNVGDGMTG